MASSLPGVQKDIGEVLALGFDGIQGGLLAFGAIKCYNSDGVWLRFVAYCGCLGTDFDGVGLDLIEELSWD